jgi:hypothetical protein
VGSPNHNLHVLRARNNFFSGPIPVAFWELRQLIAVDFTNNMCAVRVSWRVRHA